MFENEVIQKFKRIFDISKVTFDLPGDSQEQDCLFVEVTDARNSIKDGRAVSLVTGKTRIFSIHGKLPFGFLSKAIKNAEPSDTKDFFFFSIEENHNVFQNINERSFEFKYFFDGQYDPDLGTITSVDFSEEG